LASPTNSEPVQHSCGCHNLLELRRFHKEGSNVVKRRKGYARPRCLGRWNKLAKIIAPLAAEGVEALATPLPLTSFADDVAALDRTLERVEGPVVLAGHAYAGAVIGRPAARR
jgi:hypothetical protein